MELLLLLVSASGTPKDRKHFRAILSKLSRNILHLSFFFFKHSKDKAEILQFTSQS